MANPKATQEVVIELSNGTKGVFKGRAICWPGQNEGVTVVGVKFFAPKLTTKAKETPTEPVNQCPTGSTPGPQTKSPPTS